MNVLIINASPRKNGLISQMLSIMEEDAVQHGAIVKRIVANDCVVRPCVGCMACRKKGACVLPEDDAQRVLSMIQAADMVIVGAPCYWGNIPGQLKLIFDRIVYGMMRDTDRFPEPLMKGKKAVFVSTCTTPFPFNILFKQSRGAVNALKEIFHYAGFKVVKTIERGNTAKDTKLTAKDIKKCKSINWNV